MLYAMFAVLVVVVIAAYSLIAEAGEDAQSDNRRGCEHTLGESYRSGDYVPVLSGVYDLAYRWYRV